MMILEADILSLNMLKDVNVDVLKIDMKFLKMDENTMDKGMGILEAVTRMANIMGLRMIAEGVETEDQINYLLNMGCIYGQGYFFYKPLPVEEIKYFSMTRIMWITGGFRHEKLSMCVSRICFSLSWQVTAY